MKMPKDMFIQLLADQMKAEDNYTRNIKHNAGRHNYWTIYRLEHDGKTFYWAECCATANTRISSIRQICGRY